MSGVMQAMRGAPYTAADLETMPDDGRRYEIIDGVLIVSPAPTWQHQRVVTRVWQRMAATCPESLEVFVAPLDVALGQSSVLEPDVLVVPRSVLGAHVLVGLPLLAVEVLSPSTRRFDLTVKRSRYEAAGVPSYWVVDPDEPRLIAWELRDVAYMQVADVRGEQPFAASLPYPITVVPEELVAD